MTTSFQLAPLVFIHRGNAPHLFLALLQAKRNNPNREIILLGDRSTAYYQWMLGIKHVDFGTFLGRGRQLESIFRNDSTNGPEFELFCLQRWFILHEFLEQQGLGARCIYLDSDILVYGDLCEPEADFANFPMTMQVCSGHSCFINSVAVLGEFTNFIFEHYANSVKNAELLRHTEPLRHTRPPWNISDMSFFVMFHERYPKKMISLEFPMKDRYALDQTLDDDYGGFEMKNGLKKLVWHDGIPYCRHLLTGKLIRFHTLHFQGKSKPQMRHCCKLSGAREFIALSANGINLLGGRAFRWVSKSVPTIQ